MPVTADEKTEARNDGAMGSVIVQGILTGLYTYLLFRTMILAAPRLRKGLHIPLTITLSILYILNIMNLAASWSVIRSIVITHKETWQTVIFGPMNLVTTVSFNVSVLIADILLVWRCYMVWGRNNWLLAALSVPLLAEIAATLIVLVLNGKTETGINTLRGIKLSSVFNTTFNFLSVGITAIATFLIVFRILTMSRESTNRYRYITDILIQSGILYSSLNLISGIMIQVLQQRNQGHSSLSATIAIFYITSILQSMAGITPTMIFERVITGVEATEEKWSKPLSILNFKKTTRKSDTGLDMDIEAPHDNGVGDWEKNSANSGDKIQQESLPTWRTGGDMGERRIRTVASV